MKTYSCVRKLDELGRITLPLELRKTMSIEEKDLLEIYVEKNIICLKAVKEKCSCCNEEKENMQRIGNAVLCDECVEKIAEVAGIRGYGI